MTCCRYRIFLVRFDSFHVWFDVFGFGIFSRKKSLRLSIYLLERRVHSTLFYLYNEYEWDKWCIKSVVDVLFLIVLTFFGLCLVWNRIDDIFRYLLCLIMTLIHPNNKCRVIQSMQHRKYLLSICIIQYDLSIKRYSQMIRETEPTHFIRFINYCNSSLEHRKHTTVNVRCAIKCFVFHI